MQRSRRTLLKSGLALAGLASGRGAIALGRQRSTTPPNAGARERSIDTPVLRIGFEESGDPQGFPIVLLHGFPDTPHSWRASLIERGRLSFVDTSRLHGSPSPPLSKDY